MHLFPSSAFDLSQLLSLAHLPVLFYQGSKGAKQCNRDFPEPVGCTTMTSFPVCNASIAATWKLLHCTTLSLRFSNSNSFIVQRANKGEQSQNRLVENMVRETVDNDQYHHQNCTHLSYLWSCQHLSNHSSHSLALHLKCLLALSILPVHLVMLLDSLIKPESTATIH